MNPDSGSSAETAIVVRRLWEEYLWLHECLPGVTVVRRREVHTGLAILDVLTVRSGDGAARDVYFDVSASDGYLQPTLPCPYCGEPLATVKARQCAHCFADFHDPERVIFRNGREHVGRVRARVEERRDAEASQPGLNDPCGTFTALFQPTRATASVFILHFPERQSELDARVFRIGVEALFAEGCRGIVCDLERPLRHVCQSTNTGDEQLSLVMTRVTRLLRFFGRRVVVLRGQAVIAGRFVPLENYEREADAIAAVTERLE